MNPDLRLLPSKKNPQVRRWQDVAPEHFHSKAAAQDRYSWLHLAHDPEFQTKFEHLGDETLDRLAQASQGEFLGMHPRDYPPIATPKGRVQPYDSVLFYPRRIAVDSDHLELLRVKNPDQALANLTGTAFPLLAKLSDPDKNHFRTSYEDDTLITEFGLYRPDGEKLLHLERYFEEPYMGDRFDEMHNAYLTLHDDMQGAGLASAMYASQERYAPKLGVSRVTMLANITVGGYAWPLMGYDFEGNGDRDYCRQRLFDKLSDYSYELNYEQYHRAEAEIDDLDHSWEMALYNLDHFGVRGEASKLGKIALLGANYHVVRDFYDPESDAVRDATIARRVKEIRAALELSLIHI